MDKPLQSLDTIVYRGTMDLVYGSPSIPLLSLLAPSYCHAPQIYAGTRRTRWSWDKAKGGKGPAMVVDSVKSMAAERRFIEIPSRIEQRRSPGQEFQFRPFQMTSSLLTIMTTPNYILVSTFHGSPPARNQAPAIGFRTWTKVKKGIWSGNCIFPPLHPDSDIVPYRPL